MSKKSQVYLSAFAMYVVAALAGYINSFSNYWVVFVLSLLITVFTITRVFSEEREVFKETLLDWVSVCSFLGLETVLTVCKEIIKLEYTGFFSLFNYSVQFLGYMFIIYSIVRFVISYTRIDNTIKELFVGNRYKNTNNDIYVENGTENYVHETNETIKSETADFDADFNVEVESYQENTKGATTGVIGIEYIKEPEVETPYMEEEL